LDHHYPEIVSDHEMVDYLISLPERTLRVLAVFFGGLVHETAKVLLPGWLRRSRLYQATIGGLLRIAIEFVGVSPVYYQRTTWTPKTLMLKPAAEKRKPREALP